MGERLILRYDTVGSFLFIELCSPYSEQDSDMIDDAVVARFNLATGDLESVEVLFFDSWLKNEGEIRIPVSAELRPADSVPMQTKGDSIEPVAPMIVNYDFDSDLLSICQGDDHFRQRQVEISDGVLASLDCETGEIERLEIRSFKARTQREGKIVLPIKATLRLIEPSPVFE